MSKYQLFPALDSATEAALRASIRRFGVLVPVVRDQDGNLLDGHHRARIADDLGIKYRVDVVRVASADEGRAIVETLNTDRGHRLKSDMRREVVADLREQGHSLRAIAGAVGVDKETVRKDLSPVDPSTPDRIVGRDGKSYPATRAIIVAAKNEREAERAQAALSLVDAMPNTTVVDVRRVERIAREQQVQRARESEPIGAAYGDGDCRILHADFRALTDLAPVDCIITDPPYPAEYLDLYGDLSLVASRMLKPGGCVVAMVGHAHLPAYIEALARHLTYRWTCCYLASGPGTRVHAAAMRTQWKPLLVFERPGPRRFITLDVFRSDGPDKEHHHWGQGVGGFAEIVTRFTDPGDLVFDPFLGGGTTAIACRELGRRFIGCDTDTAAVAASRERLGV